MGSSVPIALHRWVFISTIGLFCCSSLRHWLLRSGAYDLGYFDQAIYLISQGMPPIVSFWGYHFLGGHGDWMIYPIALLYKILPSVYWLFAIQAAALSAGYWGVWLLSRQAGLGQAAAWAMIWVYGCYPLVFNLNLFDFHPEVMALPLLMFAIWAARGDRLWLFAGLLIPILGCRAALSITVVAMGIWLWGVEGRRRAGALAILWGAGWFGFVTQVLIPHFRPGGVEAVARYGVLGSSLSEVILNCFLQPQVVASLIFRGESIGYFALLLLPMFWMLRPRFLAPMIVAIPTLFINLLSSLPSQRDLVHQYSLPILPFMIVSGIACLGENAPILLRRPRWIMAWSLFGFLCLAKYSYFGTKYLAYQDNAAAVHQAIAQVPPVVSVLTNHNIAPHLTHRADLQISDVRSNAPMVVDRYQYILLNTRHLDFGNTPEWTAAALQRLRDDRTVDLKWAKDDVYLFVRR